eukprot:5665224-Prymnesium_polylepis.1
MDHCVWSGNKYFQPAEKPMMHIRYIRASMIYAVEQTGILVRADRQEVAQVEPGGRVELRPMLEEWQTLDSTVLTARRQRT